MAQRRTDLAVEAHLLWGVGAGEGPSLPGVRAEERERDGFPVTAVTIGSPEGAQALGKPEGVYVTIELDGLLRREEGAFRRAVEAVAAELRPLLPEDGPALVMGLGSRTVTPDLIGPSAVDHLLVTRHLVEGIPEHFGSLRPVAASAPGVLASTGMESSLIAQALAGELRPACVVAVDALASRSRPMSWACSMSTPPVMRMISLEINTASLKSSGARTSRTAGPEGLWGTSVRGPPGFFSMTGRAAQRTSGVER